MEAHHSNNMKTGITFIGVVAFLMLVMTMSIGIVAMAEVSINRITGGDLTVFMIPTNSQ